MQQNVPFQDQYGSRGDICCVWLCVIMEQNDLTLLVGCFLLANVVGTMQLGQIIMLINSVARRKIFPANKLLAVPANAKHNLFWDGDRNG